MDVRPYTRLSEIYDTGWSGMATRYVPLLARLLDEMRRPEASVLDLACGTGILATALAERGHRVHGIDRSPEMIRIAREKAEGLSNVSFEVGDIRRIGSDDAYDLVTCTYDSVNYLTDPADLRALFASVADCLSPSGMFVFDSNLESHYIENSPFSREEEWQGETVQHTGDYDREAREVRIVFRFADGSVEVHRQRPYDLDELSSNLAAAGLNIVERYSNPEQDEFVPCVGRVVCIARSMHVAPS